MQIKKEELKEKEMIKIEKGSFIECQYKIIVVTKSFNKRKSNYENQTENDDKSNCIIV